ncbi:unnamed protein product [Rotaria socialis]
MDPIAILKVIYETAALIKQTVDNAKVNEKQCKRLEERIGAISESLISINDRDLQRPELKKSLGNFRNCVKQCLDFVTQFNDEKWYSYKKIFKTQAHKEQFDEMNLQLSQCATDLNLGINLKQMFDRKLDESDQKVDLKNIESKIDEITTMMEKKYEEQVLRFKAMEENNTQRHNSMKSLIMECNKERGDSARACKIEEEKNAYRQIPYDDLIIEKCIGRGGFADVYRGKWLSHDHEVVIKLIRIEHLDDRGKEDFINEISVMYLTRYEHILNIFGACMGPTKYALIVEYMSLGSLYDVLQRKKPQLTWSDRLSVANQMIKGVNYLHKLPKPIIHRDIKSVNILMTDNVKGFLVKIADFGLAKIRHETSRQSSHGPLVGTLPWKAPELLKMGKHTEASDIYALGVVLWELATESEPYEDSDLSTISAFVLRGDRLDIPDGIPSRFRELISRAWVHEPQRRPTCQELLNSMKDVFCEPDVNKKPPNNASAITKKVATDSSRIASSHEYNRNLPKSNEKENRAVNIHANAKWTQKGMTIAGGNGEGDATNQLYYPQGLFVDDDKTVVIADCWNNRIIQWKKDDTANGQVVAGGKGQGNGLHQLNGPTDVLIDNEMDSLIICDGRRIVRWFRLSDRRQGEILIDNIQCYGLTLDEQRYLYVSDVVKHEVRRYELGEKNGTLVAGGNGKGSSLNQLNEPRYLFVDRQQNVYVSDSENNRVMKWNKGEKRGIVVAGGQGKGDALTQLNGPNGLFVDTLGTLYVVDSLNNRVMRWTQGAKQGAVIVGGNGQGAGANQFKCPIGLSFDRQGNLYVTDHDNNRVQRFSIE